MVETFGLPCVYPAVPRTQCKKFLENKEIILTDNFSIKEWLSNMLSKYSSEEISHMAN